MQLTNMFNNRSIFSHLLKKKINQLKKHNKNHLAEISNKLFFNKNGYFGSNYIADFLANKFKINRLTLTKNPDHAVKVVNLKSKKLKKISKDLSHIIQDINFS